MKLDKPKQQGQTANTSVPTRRAGPVQRRHGDPNAGSRIPSRRRYGSVQFQAREGEPDVDSPETPAGSATAGSDADEVAGAGVQRRAGAASPPATEQVHAAAAQGISGAGVALPYREQIQAAFGSHDLSDVKAHIGGAATEASTAMGAEAYATGNHVAFRESPSLHTAAHEAAHIVQQREGVSLAGGVGTAGDPYEQAADRVADAVVRGEPASAAGLPQGSGAGAAGGAVQRLDDPKPVFDKDGNAVAHKEGSLEQSYATPGTKDKKTPKAGSERGALDVKIKVNEANPIKMEAGKAPTEDALFERVEPAGAEGKAKAGGTHVKGIRGTVAAPMINKKPDPDAIYIDGKPVADDIRQVGFADCYMLSQLINVVNRDPGHITGMIANAAGTAMVVFWRKVTLPMVGDLWFPAPITVSKSFLTLAGGQLVGAGYRRAEKPKTSAWFAKIEGGKLSVVRNDFYQLALWAPIMEKAYAAYIERHGQYGGLQPGNESKAGHANDPGYLLMNGGVAAWTLKVLYGPQVADTSMAFTGTSFTAGQSTAGALTANQVPIENLIRLKKKAADTLKRGATTDMASGEQFMMTAQIGRVEAIKRCKKQVDFVLTDPGCHVNRYKTFKKHLKAMQTTLAGGDHGKISKKAGELIKPGNWPILHSKSKAHEQYRILNEFLNICALIQTDHSTGQRQVYAWHSYAVVDATFVDDKGQPVALTLSNIGTELAKVDGNKSTVTLRNPHGTNEPDPDGKKVKKGGSLDGRDEGQFDLTLAQFLRNYGQEQSGVVKK